VFYFCVVVVYVCVAAMQAKKGIQGLACMDGGVYAKRSHVYGLLSEGNPLLRCATAQSFISFIYLYLVLRIMAGFQVASVAAQFLRSSTILLGFQRNANCWQIVGICRRCMIA
jgi:hypothetical protein